MNATSVSWTLALFFGSAIAFGAIRKLTEGQGALVTLAAQLVALALIVAAESPHHEDDPDDDEREDHQLRRQGHERALALGELPDRAEGNRGAEEQRQGP